MARTQLYLVRHGEQDRPPITPLTGAFHSSVANRPTGWVDGCARCLSRPSTTVRCSGLPRPPTSSPAISRRYRDTHATS